jgi:polyhydroxyalkanoate synthesis repressor PhaR
VLRRTMTEGRARRPLRLAGTPRRLGRRMRLRPSTDAILIKKYGNRRLYDTRASSYITLEELEGIVRRGDDVRVIDAKTSEDLTQATLAQIILEGGRAARLLPVPLLFQLIRMGDEALAEFMGRYMSATLEMYLEAKRGAQTVSPYLPMATMPFQAANAFARMLLGAGQMIAPDAPAPKNVPTPAPAEPDSTGVEVAALRRELDELKAALAPSKRKR